MNLEVRLRRAGHPFNMGSREQLGTSWGESLQMGLGPGKLESPGAAIL